MSTYHRRSRFAIPGICPCHGSAPHVLTKKSPAAIERPARKSGKPRKGSSGHARLSFRSQGRGTAGQRSGQGSRR